MRECPRESIFGGIAVPRNVVRLALLTAALIAVGGAGALPPNGPSPNIVISQVYGGGGNAGAQFNADFIELFNRGSAAQSIAGWSVQYASATGTGNFVATALSAVSIPAGGYYLVGEAGGATGAPLPTPDATGTTNMSATGGKVALVNQAASLACNGNSTPCDATATGHIVDLLGYDGANFSEGSPAPTLSNTTAAFRAVHGCTDTDSNAADFTAGAPAPRNSATVSAPCGSVGDAAPSVSSTSPANGATGVPASSNLSVTFSEPVTLDIGVFSITCTSGLHSPAVSGGPTTFTLDPAADFTAGESCSVKVTATAVHDVDTNDPPDTMAADYTFSFTVAAPVVLTPIHTIQGAAHISPLAGQTVSTTGIVTAKTTNGFYLQDPNADARSRHLRGDLRLHELVAARGDRRRGTGHRQGERVSAGGRGADADRARLTPVGGGHLERQPAAGAGPDRPGRAHSAAADDRGRRDRQRRDERHLRSFAGRARLLGEPRIDADRDRRRGRRRPDELVRRNADRLERRRDICARRAAA